MDWKARNRIARRITAGGGAGIDFSIEEFGEKHQITYRVVPNGNDFSLDEIEGEIQVEKFSAEGYYDGDSNVEASYVFSGFRLSDKEVKECVGEIVEYYQDKDWFVEEVKRGDICAYVYAMNDRPMSSVYSAGWIRGILEAGDEVEFRNNFEIGLYNESGNIRIDSMEAVMSIYGTVSEDGEMWYHDVFIDPPDDEEEEDED